MNAAQCKSVIETLTDLDRLIQVQCEQFDRSIAPLREHCKQFDIMLAKMTVDWNAVSANGRLNLAAMTRFATKSAPRSDS